MIDPTSTSPTAYELIRDSKNAGWPTTVVKGELVAKCRDYGQPLEARALTRDALLVEIEKAIVGRKIAPPKKAGLINTDTVILGSMVVGGAMVAFSDKGTTLRKAGWIVAVAPAATLVGGIFAIMVGPSLAGLAIQGASKVFDPLIMAYKTKFPSTPSYQLAPAARNPQ